MSNDERWNRIVEFPSYSVSSLGRIRRDSGGSGAVPGKLLKLNTVHNGYVYAKFYESNGRRNYYIHRLVAKAFIPNPEAKPFVNHLNGIKADNSVGNLEWVTRSENDAHSIANNLRSCGSRQYAARLTDDAVREIRLSQDETDVYFAKKFGVSGRTIGKARSGLTWRHVDPKAVSQ